MPRMSENDPSSDIPGLHVPALPPVDMIIRPLAEAGGDDDGDGPDASDGADEADGAGGSGAPAAPDEAGAGAAEPAPLTQEMSAAVAKAYADAVPRPTGAAAAAHPPQIPLAPAKRVQARFNPLADWALYVVVFVGGCLGTALRYGLSLVMPVPVAAHGFWSAFHTATFLANMCACLLFAWLATYLSQASWIRKRARQLVSRGAGMGFCGGFSTLSAMVIEELTAIQRGQIAGFVAYALASFVCGLLVAAVGVKAALLMSARRAARSHEVQHVAPSAPPAGDYGQPQAGGDAGGAAGTGAPAAIDGTAVTGVAGAAAVPVAIEPEPVTDEIPLVADPIAGVAEERTSGPAGHATGGADHAAPAGEARP